MTTNLFTQNIAEITISYSCKVKPHERKQISKSENAYEVFNEIWDGIQHHESFYAMLLNRANKVLGITKISTGGISGTVVDPKIVFQAGLKANATSIILAHNHPSGQIHPSEADIRLTEQLKKAGEILEMPVLDHIILGDDRYYSFSDEGKI